MLQGGDATAIGHTIANSDKGGFALADTDVRLVACLLPLLPHRRLASYPAAPGCQPEIPQPTDCPACPPLPLTWICR